MSCNYEPIIASDGAALQLLKKEFPDLIAIELPSYNIKYPKQGYLLNLKLLTNSLKIRHVIKAEQDLIQSIIDTYNIKGIILGNRFGVYCKTIPSVYVTHQLKVLSGRSTWSSTKMHNTIIKKFDQCWIPDFENHLNLSGDLGYLKKTIALILNIIGAFSRFNKIDCKIRYDLIVLLS